MQRLLPLAAGLIPEVTDTAGHGEHRNYFSSYTAVPIVDAVPLYLSNPRDQALAKVRHTMLLRDGGTK